MLKNIEARETTKNKKDVLLEAFNVGDLAKIKRILSKYHSRIHSTTLCDLFYTAYKKRYFHICSYLINVNQNDINTRILSYACENEYVGFVKYLIPILPNIDTRHVYSNQACNESRNSALYLAVEKNNFKIVQLLLDNGADVNYTGDGHDHIIHAACQNNNLDMLKLLLEYGANIHAIGWLGRTALHYACYAIHFERKEDFFLSSSYAHFDNFDYDSDEIAKNKTCPFDLDEIIISDIEPTSILDFFEYLMTFEFDINSRDEWDRTPLFYACENSCIDAKVIKYLISIGADVNAQNDKGETVFLNSSLKMKEYLLEHGANPNIANENGETAFLLAAYYCNLEMLELLVKYGADVDVTTKHGENALHLASLFYSAEIEDIEYLLSLGVDAHARTDSGETVLHYAFKAGMIDIAEYLIGIGVDWRIKDNEGCSILHAHCSSYRSTVYGAEYLVSLGLDVNERSDDGRTALLHAAYDGQTDVMEYLIEQGADIQACSNDGKSALHWSCEYSIGMYRPTYLADIGVDVNAQDDNGETYIHKLIYACGYNHISKPIVDHLVECGARLDIKDKEGNTVFDICG